MEIQLPRPSAKNIQSDMRLNQECVLLLKTHRFTRLKTSEDSVSYSFLCLIVIVDKPFLQPRKDYDDYTRFINDTYAGEKEQMLS